MHYKDKSEIYSKNGNKSNEYFHESNRRHNLILCKGEFFNNDTFVENITIYMLKSQ